MTKIREIAGSPPFGGVNVVLDNYGSQELLDLSIMITALRARIILISTNVDKITDKIGVPGQIMIGKHLTLAASRSALHDEQVQVLELAAAGKITMPIEAVFELEDMARAHELLDSGKHVGKIVVRG
jgi:NADPH:quinone reductase-like Zn-dependent oxidoreductase